MNIKRISIFIALITGILLSSCKRERPLTEAEVINVIKTFDEGWKNKNLGEVDSVLAPGYIYYTRSGTVYSRQGVVKTSGSPEYQLEEMRRNGIHVQLQGNTAVVSTKWYGKGIYRNKPFDEEQRCSITITKVKGRVQILSEHCTPISNNVEESLVKTAVNF